jgi:hypothetical protein
MKNAPFNLDAAWQFCLLSVRYYVYPSTVCLLRCLRL